MYLFNNTVRSDIVKRAKVTMCFSRKKPEKYKQRDKKKEDEHKKSPAEAGSFLLHKLFEWRWPEVETSLDFQSKLHASIHKFRKTEISEFFFKTMNQPKEEFATIKFNGVPCPRKVRMEEFHPTQRITLPFRRAQGR